MRLPPLAICLILAACGGQEGASPTDDPSGSVAPKSTFKLTLTDDGGGSLRVKNVLCVGSSCENTFAPGTHVEVAAVPDQGWKFTGFGGDCGGMSCALTMDADHTVTGSFARQQ